ncbi:hypothetical protein FHY15_002842 [Xanthomonas arboricola]|nr:hypothetical protein [Xanthomonas arboricola]
MTTIPKNLVLEAVRAAVSNAQSKIKAAQAAAAIGGATNIAVARYKGAAALAQGKAYELRVLKRVLDLMCADGYTLYCQQKKTDVLTFGGSPCRPNLPQHDWIGARKGADEFQVWVSVQFCTLSHSLRSPPAAVQQSDRHEIDVGVYRVLQGTSYPTLSQIVFAASCKTGRWSKAYIREALGLRRELGYLAKPSQSRALWYKSKVQSRPAIPLAFFSSNLSCRAYKSLSRLGLEVEYFP